MDVDLRKYTWGGMQATWGQGDDLKRNHYTSACFGDLLYSPTDYITVGEKAPPLNLYFLRFVPHEFAQNWLQFLRTHIIPKDVLSKMEFTRIKTKKEWPLTSRDENWDPDIAEWVGRDEFGPDYDEEKWAEGRQGPYNGCVPWMKVSFDQSLSINDIFTAGIFLRKPAEHGRTVMGLWYLSEVAKEITDPNVLLSLAMHMGGATQHSISNVFQVPQENPLKFLSTIIWRDNWQVMHDKKKPLFAAPRKDDNVDGWFLFPRLNQGAKYHYRSGAPAVWKREDNSLTLMHRDPTLLMNTILKEVSDAA